MIRRSTRRRRLLMVLLPAGLAGCHQRVSQSTECLPAPAAAVQADAVALLSGSHDVQLTATSGSQAGRTITGRLVLRPQAESLRAGPWVPAEQAFAGTLDMEPDGIGAIRTGELTATDAVQPGVGVYVSPAANGTVTVVARLGASANSRGDQPFDAGYFALYVREITPSVIRGGWASGDGRQEVAAGHFCARRR